MIKNGMKWAGSHTWGATKSYWKKKGVESLVGGSKHHWAISQKLMERYPNLLKIGNQPWNIIKFANHSSHMRLAHGRTFMRNPGAGFLGRVWYGTPGWFKAGTVTGGLYFGDVIENNKR